MATHAGMTTEEFSGIVRDWLATARHPTIGKPYTQVACQPMLELLVYLRACGFTTFIVSGGGVEFMPVFAEEVYGIPPQQVVGSTIKTHFELREGKPVLIRDPALEFFDESGQAGGDQQVHRAPCDRLFREFGWRSRNVTLDHARTSRRSPVVWTHRPSHRWRTRVRL